MEQTESKNTLRMKGTLSLAPHLPFTLTKISAPTQRRSLPRRKSVFPRIQASPQEASTVDYSSSTSVFPAEACETLGGDACAPEMYPEVKLNPEPSKARVVSEEIDREYVEYNEPKTVFPGEACDELGGEFCEPQYQMGVFEEKTLSK